MRLDKFISNNSIYSRKEVNKFIRKKLVKVNEQIIIDPAFKLSLENDIVKINEHIIENNNLLYIVLNKPKGYVCSNNDNDGISALNLINEAYVKNLHFIGRLDKDTTGLILLTNDGNFTHEIKSSKYKIETLMNLGANINIQDNDGNGILHYILSRDHIGTEEYDIIEMLIKNGIDINLQNNDGDTALHKISYKKNNSYRDIGMEKKVISLLIENNADKNIKNNNGQKAYPSVFIYNIKLIFSKIFNDILYPIFMLLLIIIVAIPSFIFYVISGFIENIAGFFR